MTVGDIARTMPRINATLENRQVDYQTSMVEVEGKLNQIPISILIDPRASLSYISPDLVEKCKLSVEKFTKSWLFQLDTGAKRQVMNFVENCTVTMDQFETSVKFNVLPLGSYDMLIGMDWLEKHTMVLNCFDKTFTCINSDGKIVVRQISALQLKRVVRKDCKAFAVTVINEENTDNKDKLKLEDILILREYSDVLLE